MSEPIKVTCVTCGEPCPPGPGSGHSRQECLDAVIAARDKLKEEVSDLKRQMDKLTWGSWD